MSHLSISLLGAYQLTLNGIPVTGLTLRKARALLAYLTVESHHAHSREALAALLWPERSQDSASHSLRQTLYHLRATLTQPEPPGGRSATTPCLRVTRGEVRFEGGDDCWLDVAAFTRLLEACRAHSHRRLDACPACAKRLQEAVDLYQGDFLGSFSVSDSPPFEEWRTVEQEELHGQVMQALTHLAVYYERCREYPQAARVLQRQLELEPWREEAHRGRMRVLALGGQRSAALAQYAACCRALAEELGIGPRPRRRPCTRASRPEHLSPSGSRARIPTRG